MTDEYVAHKAAGLFPMMSATELKELADDIRRSGQINPIILYEGAILDGRNRLAACGLAKVEPRFESVKELPNGACAYVMSQNLKRRHLPAAKRASLSVKAAKMMMSEARARQLAGQQSGGRGKNKLGGPKDPRVKEADKSIVRAAKQAGAGVGQAKVMQRVERDAPDVFIAVEAGTVRTVADAERLAEVKDPQQREQAIELVKGGAKVEHAIAQVGGDSTDTTAPPGRRDSKLAAVAERDEKIRQLLKQGEGIAEVAAAVGCSYSQVQAAKQRLGITGGRKNPLNRMYETVYGFCGVMKHGYLPELGEQATVDELQQLDDQLAVLYTAVGQFKKRCRADIEAKQADVARHHHHDDVKGEEHQGQAC